MIVVHRLRGAEFVLNADLIESVEATPDTVVTLVDGRRLVVEEPPDDIVAAVIRYRASQLAAAADLRSTNGQVIGFPGES